MGTLYIVALYIVTLYIYMGSIYTLIYLMALYIGALYMCSREETRGRSARCRTFADHNIAVGVPHTQPTASNRHAHAGTITCTHARLLGRPTDELREAQRSRGGHGAPHDAPLPSCGRPVAHKPRVLGHVLLATSAGGHLRG